MRYFGIRSLLRPLVTSMLVLCQTIVFGQSQSPALDTIKKYLNAYEGRNLGYYIREGNKTRYPESVDELLDYVNTHEQSVIYLSLRDHPGSKFLFSFKGQQPNGYWKVSPQPPYSRSYEGYYKNGVKDSIWSYSTGSANGDEVIFSGRYVKGKPHGKWSARNRDTHWMYKEFWYDHGRSARSPADLRIHSLKIGQYTEDPGEVEDQYGRQPIAIEHWDLKTIPMRVEHPEFDETTVSFYSENPSVISMKVAPFDTNQYKIKRHPQWTIDGVRVYGGGYNERNMDGALESIARKNGKQTIKLSSEAHRYFVRFHKSSLQAFYLPDLKKIVLSFYGNGDGEYYHTFLFIDAERHEYQGRYINRCGYPSTYCPDNLDFMAPNGSQYYYRMEFVYETH